MSSKNPHNAVWCIFLRSLPVGGVERQFATLVNRLSERRRVLLVTLFGCQENAEALISQGVERHSLFDLEDPGKTPFRLLLAAPRKLAELCRREEVDVVYSARDVANLVAALACRKVPGIRLLWGHRSSAHKFSRRLRLLHPICRLVQGRVHCQIANSHDGIEFYRSLGLCRGQSAMLPNFLDSEIFFPDPDIREKQRNSWDLEDDVIALGIVGRVAPMKNHEGFLQMASSVVGQLPRVRFLIIGPSRGQSLTWLQKRIEYYNLSGHVALLPAHPMNQMRQVYNALDVLCSPSLYGEGFCNVIAEAMACGCPVVATDVGEARNMLAGLIPVIRAGDNDAYKEAVLALVQNPPPGLAGRLRERIVQLCDLERIISRIIEIGEKGITPPGQPDPVLPRQ